jgi:hypothetical protein
VLSIIFFLGLGLVPLGRWGKTGDETTLRIIPALFEAFRAEPPSAGELTELAVFLAFWIAAAVALAWLAQCVVVIFLSRKHDKANVQH